jgi:hypothetical protein
MLLFEDKVDTGIAVCLTGIHRQGQLRVIVDGRLPASAASVRRSTPVGRIEGPTHAAR